jgi:G3E family GTPase
MATGEADERMLVDLLTDQVEFANILILNKTDLVKPSQLARLEAILRRLNPHATILHSEFGKVAPRSILNTGLFDFAQAQQAPGWYQELQGNHLPETEEYGISSFVYRAYRPFHPQRFMQVMTSSAVDGVIRAKGYFWLATRMESAMLWSQAGGVKRVGLAGQWFAAVPRDLWEQYPEAHQRAQQHWHDPYGDRRQEIVFIGVDVDRAGLSAALDAALLDKGEWAQDPDKWANFPDPFPQLGASGMEAEA